MYTTFISSGYPFIHITLDRSFADDEGSNRTRIATNLVQALSLVQGAALMHYATKAFLGSKYCIEVRDST